MYTPQIRVKTEGFRAIANADIIIDGITVVTGENGCGKSTLSKLLYYLYKTGTNYEKLVVDELRKKLSDTYRFLQVVIPDLSFALNEKNAKKELEEFYNEDSLSENLLEKWKMFISKISHVFSRVSTEQQDLLFQSSWKTRMKHILGDILDQNESPSKDFQEIFNELTNHVASIFNESFEKINSRPVGLFLDAIDSIFSEGKLPRKFEVYEYESQIVAMDKTNLSVFYSIDNAIYLDTPMVLLNEQSENDHWNDLRALLLKKGKSTSSNLNTILNNEILKGDVSLDDSLYNRFVFKRVDGTTFNLFDCATGVRSFGILQLLLKNGSLTDKTLFIIDEPESHLHPQWIIEYARMIVLLHKEIGVKFFIASHNPDMVSAIKYISMKEGVEDKLNYYLAEKSENKFMYNYLHLKQEIDPIFASFNIAIDRINQYGI